MPLAYHFIGLGMLGLQSPDAGEPTVQQWLQVGLALASVAAAVAWLTARWLIRRKAGCAGDCSRCVAGGAEVGPCQRPPTTGVRPPGLHVLQGPANLPRSGDV